jgi:uncharacterized protein (TIGR03643 family)
MKVQIHADQISLVIRLAWEDRTTFEEIKTRTGLAEHEVIDIMRRELKPSSFAMWRKRVAGRVTKHRKLLERRLKSPSRTFNESDEAYIDADEPTSKDAS